MAWRVLLLGCPTAGLVGVAADLARIRRVLVGRGVDEPAIEALAAATRAELLAALDALAAAVRPGDGVVVYYSGHGVRLRDPATGAWCYALVPVRAGADDFPFVLREELEDRLGRVTAVTRNVTWIADCCHAAGVYRGPRVRALPEAQVAFLARRARLLDGRAAPQDPRGNPHVVRVCASTDDRGAFEDARGGRLTRALEAALAPLGGAPVTCDDLGRRLAAQALLGEQLPVVAGPVARWWLSEVLAPRGIAPAAIQQGGATIAGGRLLDHRVGDRFTLLDARHEPAGAVEISEVRTADSWIRRVGGVGPIAAGTTAVLARAAEPRGAVAFDAPLPRLLEALTAHALAVPAGPAVRAPRIARVRGDDRAPLILATGEVGPPCTLPDPTAACVVLEGLARQAALQALRPSDAEGLVGVEATWSSGALALRNRTGQACYATLFALRPKGVIEAVTSDQPGGELVPLRGALSLTPPEAPLVLVLCSARVDLRGWCGVAGGAGETRRGGPGIRFAARTLAPASALSTPTSTEEVRVL